MFRSEDSGQQLKEFDPLLTPNPLERLETSARRVSTGS